jgi:hypothetical protein
VFACAGDYVALARKAPSERLVSRVPVERPQTRDDELNRHSTDPIATAGLLVLTGMPSPLYWQGGASNRLENRAVFARRHRAIANFAAA